MSSRQTTKGQRRYANTDISTWIRIKIPDKVDKKAKGEYSPDFVSYNVNEDMPALISPPGSRYKWRTRWARRLKEPTLQPWYQATDLLFVSAKASYDCYRHVDPDKNTNKNTDKERDKKSKGLCGLNLVSDYRPFSRVRTQCGFEADD